MPSVARALSWKNSRWGSRNCPNPSVLDDFRKIRAVFAWLSKRAPRDPIAEGNAAEAAGDLERACELYREAARLSPGVARPYLNLGIALEGRGDAPGAQAAYEQ